MPLTPARRIVIVGGGTAGWMTAAAFAKLLRPAYEVIVVESDEIGIIGVGEATIPHIRQFNAGLGIDEDDFLRHTQGSFKLGIEFVNWGGLGDRYFHGFGRVGSEDEDVSFHHYWLRRQRDGRAADLAAYAITTQAAQAARFMRARVDMAGSPLGDIAHAFHFDASLYARYLRGFAQARGVQRSEGRIVRVLQRDADGHIRALVLADGREVEGDFFIDCSGLRGLLIEQTLHAGYEDWSHWLPCDRAIAVPSVRAEPLLPLTRSTAHGAGWQWRIPLQHRTGNGHVFCSHHLSDDEATATLLAHLDGEPLAEPRTVRFQTGRRRRFWVRNCVAVGLSSGFLEPLESTSIHLIQTAIMRIVGMFPHAGFEQADIDEYNELTAFEYERVRDFLILHYHATTRTDTAFWRHCRSMPIPESLQRRLALFRANGRIARDPRDLFAESSWLQVLLGQGVQPQGYHPFADLRSEAEVDALLDRVRGVIQRCVAVMPTHADFIAAHCAAPPPG